MTTRMHMNWDNESHLETIELLAEEMGYNVNSEETLSEMFDEQIAPSIIEAHGTKGKEFTDTVMINEAFNDWKDSLCKDGEIHEEQYNNYCYVGEWSN